MPFHFAMRAPRSPADVGTIRRRRARDPLPSSKTREREHVVVDAGCRAPTSRAVPLRDGVHGHAARAAEFAARRSSALPVRSIVEHHHRVGRVWWSCRRRVGPHVDPVPTRDVVDGHAAHAVTSSPPAWILRETEPESKAANARTSKSLPENSAAPSSTSSCHPSFATRLAIAPARAAETRLTAYKRRPRFRRRARASAKHVGESCPTPSVDHVGIRPSARSSRCFTLPAVVEVAAHVQRRARSGVEARDRAHGSAALDPGHARAERDPVVPSHLAMRFALVHPRW